MSVGDGVSLGVRVSVLVAVGVFVAVALGSVVSSTTCMPEFGGSVQCSQAPASQVVFSGRGRVLPPPGPYSDLRLTLPRISS